MALIGFEAWLAGQVGSSLATEAIAKAKVRPFQRALVERLGRHALPRALTWWERWRLRKLLREPELLELLLLDKFPKGDPLVDKLREHVLRLSDERGLSKLLAIEIAAVLRTETPGALEMQDALAVLSYQIRRTDDSVGAVHDELLHVGRDVSYIRESIDDGTQRFDAYVLLRGPMDALELTGDHTRAQALVETDPAEAAILFSSIAVSLESAGYGGLARPIAIERAKVLAKAQDVREAAACWMSLVLHDLWAGSDAVSVQAATALRTLAESESAPPWLPARAEAVERATEWFRNPALPAVDLLNAMCATVAAGDPEGPLLLIIAAEAAIASGEHEAIAAIAETITTTATGASEDTRIRLQLAVADAIGDEAAWQTLLAQAEPAAAAMNPRLAALVYARRGRHLFWLGKAVESESAYRSAVERACVAKLWQDAADWLMSSWRVASRSPQIEERFLDLPRLAAAVRATGPGGLLQRGYDPYTAALEDLLDTRLNSALPHLRRFLFDSARLAHLEDELNAHIRFGELYERTGKEPAAAIAHYVVAGNAKSAARVAASVPFFIDCTPEAKSLQVQTRAAALQATAAQADLLPDSRVDEWVALALAAAVAREGGILGPQVWVQGFRLIAGLSKRIPSQQIMPILEAIDVLIPREKNTYTWADDAIVDILSGLAMGSSDCQSEVAERMIAVFDTSADMARRLLDKGAAITVTLSHLRDPLRERARQGNRQAAQILAIHADTDPAVIAAAEKSVASEISRPPAYGIGRMSILGDVALAAHESRCLSEDRRADLARSYLERALDDADAEMNRVQAMDGVIALAQNLSRSVRDELFDRVAPLAQGQVSLSPFDQLSSETAHPLSNFRIQFNAGRLRCSAVAALAALATDTDRALQAWDSARPLLKTGADGDSMAAAKVAVSLTNSGFFVPVSWPLLASSSDARLRQAAAALIGKIESVEAAVAEDLARDPDPRVRREVAGSLADLAVRDRDLASRLSALLANDVRSSVRMLVSEHFVGQAPPERRS